jgi:hypothetical protein
MASDRRLLDLQTDHNMLKDKHRVLQERTVYSASNRHSFPRRMIRCASPLTCPIRIYRPISATDPSPYSGGGSWILQARKGDSGFQDRAAEGLWLSRPFADVRTNKMKPVMRAL